AALLSLTYRPVGRCGSTSTCDTSTPAAAISATTARPNASSPTALTQLVRRPRAARWQATFDSAPPTVRVQVRTCSIAPGSAGTNRAIDSPRHSTSVPISLRSVDLPSPGWYTIPHHIVQLALQNMQ